MPKKTRKQTAEEIVQESRRELTAALADGSDKELLLTKIRELATRYADELDRKIIARKEEMEQDDNSHYLIYRVLGIKRGEGKLIDIYQNKGRFLYKYAGSFLEEAASLCFSFKNIDGCKTTVQNTMGQRPKTFEIDFLDGQNAIEVKWRDATTDGDHITKEHTRVKVIQSYGYVPVRVMFYYPQRKQAIRVQNTLKTIYAGVKGEYHAGEERMPGAMLKIIQVMISKPFWRSLQMKGHLMKVDQILHGDAVASLKDLPDNSADLVYFDPPFFSQKSHTLSNKGAEKTFTFDDCWDSLESYLNLIRSVLRESKRALRDTGSVFLHCDRSASHHIRVLMDEVFGTENFQSEIIWSYKRWSNSKKGLLNAHQSIYFYSKTSDFKFNRSFTSYSATTNVDQILQARERDQNGKAVYKRDSDGNVVLGKEKKGVPLSDVWEIPYLNPKAKERVGYPTQKPVSLLKQIIELTTDEGDLVIDPFCGSGTTCVAAKSVGRSFVGIDVSEDAVRLSMQRLEEMIISESRLLEVGKES